MPRKINSELLDPVTLEVMTDPVFFAGSTYDRSSVHKMLVSPIIPVVEARVLMEQLKVNPVILKKLKDHVFDVARQEAASGAAVTAGASGGGFAAAATAGAGSGAAAPRSIGESALVIGDEGVGKSSFILSVDGKRDRLRSNGCSRGFKTVSLPGYNIFLCLVEDSNSPQEEIGVRSGVEDRPDIFFLCIAFDTRRSLENLDRWVDGIRRYAPASAIIHVVVNKSDHVPFFQFSEVEKYVEEHELSGCSRVSSKTGEGVNEAIMTVSRKYIDYVTCPDFDVYKFALTDYLSKQIAREDLAETKRTQLRSLNERVARIKSSPTDLRECIGLAKCITYNPSRTGVEGFFTLSFMRQPRSYQALRAIFDEHNNLLPAGLIESRRLLSVGK